MLVVESPPAGGIVPRLGRRRVGRHGLAVAGRIDPRGVRGLGRQPVRRTARRHERRRGSCGRRRRRRRRRNERRRRGRRFPGAARGGVQSNRDLGDGTGPLDLDRLGRQPRRSHAGRAVDRLDFRSRERRDPAGFRPGRGDRSLRLAADGARRFVLHRPGGDERGRAAARGRQLRRPGLLRAHAHRARGRVRSSFAGHLRQQLPGGPRQRPVVRRSGSLRRRPHLLLLGLRRGRSLDDLTRRRASFSATPGRRASPSPPRPTSPRRAHSAGSRRASPRTSRRSSSGTRSRASSAPDGSMCRRAPSTCSSISARGRWRRPTPPARSSTTLRREPLRSTSSSPDTE